MNIPRFNLIFLAPAWLFFFLSGEAFYSINFLSAILCFFCGAFFIYMFSKRKESRYVYIVMAAFIACALFTHIFLPGEIGAFLTLFAFALVQRFAFKRKTKVRQIVRPVARASVGPQNKVPVRRQPVVARNARIQPRLRPVARTS